MKTKAWYIFWFSYAHPHPQIHWFSDDATAVRKTHPELRLSRTALIIAIRDSRVLTDNFYVWCSKYICGALQRPSPKFLTPWHVQDYLNGIKKATEILSTGVNFMPHPVIKDHLLSVSSNNQNCFYKIPCIKIISCSDHVFKTLQWRVATLYWRVAIPLTLAYTNIFACCY